MKFIGQIKAVIFDMDGTLIDAQLWHYQALNEALEIFGLTISENEHEEWFDGLPTRKKLERLSEERGLPEHLHTVIEQVKQERTVRLIAKNCFPRIEQLLMMQQLKHDGFKIAVATNSIEATARVMLSSAGLMPYLDLVLTNEDVREPKPNPEIYTLTAAKLGLDPAECLVLEDNQHGLESALLAGCPVVEVNRVEDVRISLISGLLRPSIRNEP